MEAIGMNKAAEEFMILDEDTRADLASGKYRDQRRGSFGPPAQPAGPLLPAGPPALAGQSESAARQARPRPRAQTSRPRWTPSQERLAVLYNSQGLRPAEIAAKLGVSSHLVTQIVLAAKNRGKA
jgi:hypothetical protein